MRHFLVPLIAAFSIANAASASVVSFLEQDGDDLVWTYSGSLILPNATTTFPTGVGSSLQAATGGYVADVGSSVEFFGAASLTKDGTAFTGDSFGTDATTRIADTASGTGGLGLFLSGVVFVDSGYVDGDAISGTLTWENLGFADLGVGSSDYGDYEWSWTTPNGETETASLSILAPTAVPLPAGLPLVLAGLGGLALLRRARG